MFTTQKKYIWVFSLLLVVLLFSGCAMKSTPPGSNSVAGMVGEAVYSYHYWMEGLEILIWHDLSYGGEGCSSTGSTDDPVFRLECQAEAQDGRSLEWVVHTTDGVTAEMWINEQAIDLSQGNMFLIQINENGSADIVQLERDLSGLNSDQETIKALAETDAEVAAFVETVGGGR